jgi:uncharacterized BrkB/YihY/UPF0761 family membrane protein
VWELTRLVAEEFRKRDLLTYASAIAFRGLVALVPLTLLGLGLLGALYLWRAGQAPAPSTVTPHAVSGTTTPKTGGER